MRGWRRERGEFRARTPGTREVELVVAGGVGDGDEGVEKSNSFWNWDASPFDCLQFLNWDAPPFDCLSFWNWDAPRVRILAATDLE